VLRKALTRIASPDIEGRNSRWDRSELLWAATIALLAIAPRIAVALIYPTRPVSDFRMLLLFAQGLRERGLTDPNAEWGLLNAGLPTILSFILRIAPGSPEAVSRIATAVWVGLAPVAVFMILRGSLSRPLRIVGALLLALWPGQIAVSAVLAQDNWVITPLVALAALAVAAVRTGRGRPVAAAVLWALVTYIRQEMLVAALPAALVAGTGAARTMAGRQVAKLALVAGALFSLIAAQRYGATGRFALTTSHGGLSLLGTYVPGYALDWSDPRPYTASVDASLLDDPGRLREEAGRLAVREIMARPPFHLVKRFAAVVTNWRSADSETLYWAFWNAEASQELPAHARTFAERVGRLARGEILVVHLLALAAFLLGALSRRMDILTLAAVVALKVAVHAVIVSQGRFFLPVLAVEALAIPLGIEVALSRPRAASLALATAAVLLAALLPASEAAVRWVERHEHDIQRTYRFTLRAPGGLAALACVVDRGWVSALAGNEARLELARRDPLPGDVARASCAVQSSPGVTAVLGVLDDYAGGGHPNRIVQRVEVDGREALRHDLAATAGSGWMEVPLELEGTSARAVTVQVAADRPDQGPAWGWAGRTTFRIEARRTSAVAEPTRRLAP
jgi:hypothetical protein